MNQTLTKIATNFGAGGSGGLLAMLSFSIERATPLLAFVSLVAGTVLAVVSAVNALHTFGTILAGRRQRRLAQRLPARPCGGGSCGRPGCDGSDFLPPLGLNDD